MFLKEVWKLKKAIIIATIAILGLIVLIKSGILDSLLLFVLVGAVPGTNYSIPSTFMLLAIMSVIWLLVFRIAAIEALNSTKSKRSTKRRTEHVKRMPKRRYSQI